MHDFCFYLSENTFWKYEFDWVLLTKSSSTGPEMCLLKYFIFKHQFLFREQNGPLWRVYIPITVRWSRNQSGLRTHEAWSQFFLNKQKFCFSQVVGLMWGFQICKYVNLEPKKLWEKSHEKTTFQWPWEWKFVGILKTNPTTWLNQKFCFFV